MNVSELAIPGVLLIEPRVLGDDRGWFMESWQRTRYEALGLPRRFVQDNLAFSAGGVLRGLHVQQPHPQGKLVQVLQGRVFDVAVDIRVGSPHFGRWVGVELSGETQRQFYVPPGLAHGYYVLSREALFMYKCTDFYHPETELGVRWDDPAIGIAWPLDGEPRLSVKDREAPLLRDLPAERLPQYPGS
ncbi:MAG: dTDP-4-dehydrorhamnose 3,5-epimerase [Chromatiales bacterium]